MSQLSRREFIQFFGRPITRTFQRAQANEKRAQAIIAAKRVDPRAQQECASCRARFAAERDEIQCPTCREREAKQHTLIADLFTK